MSKDRSGYYFEQSRNSKIIYIHLNQGQLLINLLSKQVVPKITNLLACKPSQTYPLNMA